MIFFKGGSLPPSAVFFSRSIFVVPGIKFSYTVIKLYENFKIRILFEKSRICLIIQGINSEKRLIIRKNHDFLIRILIYEFS